MLKVRPQHRGNWAFFIDGGEAALRQRFLVHLGIVSHQGGCYCFSQKSRNVKETSEVPKHDDLRMYRCLHRIDAHNWHSHGYPTALEG